MKAPRFLARMSLESVIGAELSNIRIRLLEQIALQGSINRAAKAVPMSYKAAWEAIDSLNNLSPEPVVSSAAAGSQLTAYGQSVVALYRALENDYQATLDRLANQLERPGNADIHSFQRLMRRMRLTISARNQFFGVIAGIVQDRVEAEVRVRIDDSNEIAAMVTLASTESLGLAEGVEVMAMVKASSVFLSLDPQPRCTARNQLSGEIVMIHEGPVNNEVILSLPSGRNICAVVTRASCQTLGLVPGTPACALFKASSVFLTSQS